MRCVVVRFRGVLSVAYAGVTCARPSSPDDLCAVRHATAQPDVSF
jgi:hypothetical protein